MGEGGPAVVQAVPGAESRPRPRARGIRASELGGTLPARFWAKVRTAPADECWEWLASKNRDGYGLVGRNGRPPMLAHRVSAALAGLNITGKLVCHHCDNPACVNPAHLFLGSDADNHADSRAKGRARVGSRVRHARLTEANVREIRARVAAGAEQKALAAEYGVSRAAMCKAVKRRTWRHVR